MNGDVLGPKFHEWAGLGTPDGAFRLVLVDVDGVITRGEGHAIELDVLQRLAALNDDARCDPCAPAITLCTGRPAPYVELMAQAVGAFLPCIFEHGAGLWFPEAFNFEFDPRLGADYTAPATGLRAALWEPLLAPGRAFVQPGKEASLTLYPLGETTLDQLESEARAVSARAVPDFDVARNVHGIELRPSGITKGTGARRLAELVGLPLDRIAAVGDSDPDLSYLTLAGFSAAPANATPAVRQAVEYLAPAEYGLGLLDIVAHLKRQNIQRRL
jgi:hydroxymethylpyrimidine pyrophosphatase-like HAD family hydrolase